MKVKQEEDIIKETPHECKTNMLLLSTLQVEKRLSLLLHDNV